MEYVAENDQHRATVAETVVKRKACIVSLRYSPAFVTTFLAYAEVFAFLGMDVEFLANPRYSQFKILSQVAPVHFAASGAQAVQYDYALFLNVSVGNAKVANSLRRHGTRILYIYHEPWESLVRYLRLEGLYSTAKMIGANILSGWLLRRCDAVLLPSKRAYSTYAQRGLTQIPRAYYVPLLFSDEAIQPLSRERRYVSYIGTICHAHGFDDFVAFMRHMLETDNDVQFMIASKSVLPQSVLDDPVILEHRHRLKIRCGHILSSEEINDAYSASVCVWNVYRRSTQSGVLPHAMMMGTPVVASSVGSFPEFVQDGVNGRIVDRSDLAGIAHAVRDIQSRFQSYGASARQYFVENFSSLSNVTRVRKIIEQIDASKPNAK